MGLLDSYGVSRVPHYLGIQIRSLFFFQLRGYHPLWLCLSSRIHLKDRFVTSRESRNTLTSYPTTPRAQRLRPMAYAWFGLFRFRSPLLTESLFVFYSSRYLDVSIPSVCLNSLCIQLKITRVYLVGFPHSEIQD